MSFSATGIFYEALLPAPDSAAPWLVMVHGFSHNHDYFGQQVAAFQADFRLLLVDFRGHGRSSAVAGPFGIEEYADDVQSVLDAANIDTAIYWGTHTGTAIGLVLALRQPERLRALVLESAVLPGFAMPRVDELLARARTIAQAEGIAAARQDWFEHADWFDFIRAEPMECRADDHRQLVEAFQGEPWISPLTPRPVTPVVDCLDALTMPILLYNGVADLPDFHNVAAELESQMARVERHQIDRAGGFAGWEQPAAVNALVASYLQQIR